jgi:hypothetical protein
MKNIIYAIHTKTVNSITLFIKIQIDVRRKYFSYSESEFGLLVWVLVPPPFFCYLWLDQFIFLFVKELFHFPGSFIWRAEENVSEFCRIHFVIFRIESQTTREIKVIVF